MNTTITRNVKVNYALSLDDVLRATRAFEFGCITLRTKPDSIYNAKQANSKGQDVEIVFFELKREDYCVDEVADVQKLLEQYHSRNLVPANPYELAAANMDRSLTSCASNTTIWQSEDDKWWCLYFQQSVHGVNTLSSDDFDSLGPFLDHFESYPRLFAGVARS